MTTAVCVGSFSTVLYVGYLYLLFVINNDNDDDDDDNDDSADVAVDIFKP